MKNLTLICKSILLVLVFNFTPLAQQYSQDNLKSSLLDLNRSSEVDVAASMIKMQLPDYYPAEITAALKGSYPAVPEDRTIRVLPYVRENMITSGKDFDRAKAVADRLLKFLALQNRVRFIYFNSEVPVAAFSYPFALQISNAAAALLTDDELEAVIAHELMHLITHHNFKEAVESKNLKQQRAIELFCDGGAMAVLETMGKDPNNLIVGLDKMQEMITRLSNESESGIHHPTIKTRKQFLKKLTEKFAVAMNRAIK